MKKRKSDFIPLPGVESEILDFAASMVKVRRTDGQEDECPAGFVERELLKNGALGYLFANDESEGWYFAEKQNPVDRYGLPEFLSLRTGATAGAPFTARRGAETHTAAYIRANSSARSPLLTIRRYADIIQQCDTALRANVIASMNSQVLGVPDATVKSTVDEILDRAKMGLPAVVENSVLGQINRVDISHQFNGINIHALRQTLYSEALKHFGAVTPAQYKSERVQTAEVNAHVAETIDSVYIMIDQFNADCKAYGVPYVMEYVGFGKQFDGEEDGENGKDGQ